MYCFYQGYSKEFPKSAVTLSICSGLRGLLQFENVSYGIEPLDSSANNEHIVFQTKNNKIGYPLFQKNHLTNQYVSSSYRILVKSEKQTFAFQYDVMGSEEELVAEKVIRIFSLINSMFSQFKITVMLSTLELWSDKNKISTNGDAEEILKRFLSWKQNDPFQNPHEMSYLFIYRDYATFVGTTYHGMACDPKFATGVALYPNMGTLEAFSVVVVQLLGINLGLTYDDIYNCYCPGPMCIMNPEAILSSGIKFFSSCSMEEFKQSVSLPKFECLQYKEVPTVVFQGKSGTCGNGILEGSEQCDCGVGESCSHKKCCNPVDCTLIGFSECGTGPCCDAKTCLIANRGKLCRKSTDPCDFPEFCNGTSEFCVPDVKSADLEPCNNKTAFCFKGRCRDRDRQCLGIFGEFAKSGTYLCEEELNFHNDKFGSCRRQCNYNFVLCGKLACRWTKAVLAPSKEYDVQYTYINDQICVTASLRNVSRSDDTFVEHGSVCGEKKICLNGECKILNAYAEKPNCDSQTLCQGHGVCNERLNCHCDAGYSPPRCDETAFSPGGSVDDGFWLPTSKSHGAAQSSCSAEQFQISALGVKELKARRLRIKDISRRLLECFSLPPQIP
uniref:ADAM metallopeptidase domain 18 n=1 Tax=Oryctolagus cuniculus TaxID=9986 RepID=G1TTF3_RABIT